MEKNKWRVKNSLVMVTENFENDVNIKINQSVRQIFS